MNFVVIVRDLCLRKEILFKFDVSNNERICLFSCYNFIILILIVYFFYS